MKLIQAALISLAAAGLAFGACDSKPKTDAAPVAVEEGAKTIEAAAEKVEGAVAKVEAGAEKVAAVVADAPACEGGTGDCPFHDEKGAPKGHDHAGHDHAGHDHAGKHVDSKDEGGLGCGAHAETVAKTVTADGTHFGSAFTIADAAPLGTTLGAADADKEALVRVSGQIHKVCQKKGCWLIVKDGDAEARVIMKGYAFTVPADSTGKPAVVEGNLKVKVFTEAQAKHLAEDGGEDPATVTGEKREYLLTATAITIGNKG